MEPPHDYGAILRMSSHRFGMPQIGRRLIRI